jgi:hypothetical protein
LTEDFHRRARRERRVKLIRIQIEKTNHNPGFSFQMLLSVLPPTLSLPLEGGGEGGGDLCVEK